MIFSLEFARKTALAYNVICKPLCRELGVTQTAFDILMFLANNPDHKTARDIVEIRHIKANLSRSMWTALCRKAILCGNR